MSGDIVPVNSSAHNLRLQNTNWLFFFMHEPDFVGMINANMKVARKLYVFFPSVPTCSISVRAFQNMQVRFKGSAFKCVSHPCAYSVLLFNILILK